MYKKKKIPKQEFHQHITEVKQYLLLTPRCYTNHVYITNTSSIYFQEKKVLYEKEDFKRDVDLLLLVVDIANVC